MKKKHFVSLALSLRRSFERLAVNPRTRREITEDVADWGELQAARFDRERFREVVETGMDGSERAEQGTEYIRAVGR